MDSNCTRPSRSNIGAPFFHLCRRIHKKRSEISFSKSDFPKLLKFHDFKPSQITTHRILTNLLPRTWILQTLVNIFIAFRARPTFLTITRETTLVIITTSVITANVVSTVAFVDVKSASFPMPSRRTLANESTVLIHAISAVAPVARVTFIDVFFAVFASPAFFAFAVLDRVVLREIDPKGLKMT